MLGYKLKELFRELALIVHDQGKIDYERTASSDYEIMELNEISLLMTRETKTRVRPEAVTFELFGTDLLLTKDGTLYASEDEEHEEIFIVKDEKTLRIVSSFIKWRLKVVEIASI